MDREILAKKIEFLMGDTSINDKEAMSELVELLKNE